MSIANIPTLTTQRLTLAPLERADADAIQAVFPQWEIVQFLTTKVPWPYPPDGALTFIRDVALPAMERGEAWHWSIRPNAAPEKLIGVISLMDHPGDNRGFWLDPAWQRRGYMAEASTAVTDYWFDVLGKPVLQVPKARANERSRRISEVSGMRVVSTLERDYVSGRHLADVWEIAREEWHARRRG
jgi:RimJ/RimL family protein N-acetyltransferase